MYLIRDSHEILEHTPVELIEKAGRTCYKSENKTTQDSCKRFIKSLIKSGHESVLEHSFLSVKFIVDRGTGYEMIRHRLCSFSQESTRYCDYSTEGITYIVPLNIDVPLGMYDKRKIECFPDGDIKEWLRALWDAEQAYKKLRNLDWRPEEARTVLPSALKTEIVVSANFREWRHIFKLRALGLKGKPHPQIRQRMISLLLDAQNVIPGVFDDLKIAYT